MTVTDLRRDEQREESAERRRFAYLPGLDGLRALAIVGVLAFHLQVSWIGDGGPIGVEVFFVISGFLITSLFIVEKSSTETISLRGFWARRFKRLAPALVAMVALVTVWAMLPEPWGPGLVQKGTLRGSGLSSAAYVSNWYFIFSGQSYFEGWASPSPFRHTWSLSIEEQFYLIVAMGVAAGFALWGANRRRWPVILFVGAGLSTIWMAFLARMGNVVADGLWPFGIDPDSLPGWLATFLNFQGSGDTSRMYFGTDTRLSGVLIGAGLAFVLARADFSRWSKRVFELIGLVALAGLGAMMLLVPREWPWMYYGGFLAVDLLTAAVIVTVVSGPRSGQGDTAAVRFMALKPIVWVGVLSYSLYVWHWPIFVVLSEDRVPLRGFELVLVRLVASFAVAYLSLRFIENPIRRKGLPTQSTRIVAAGAVTMVLVSFLVVTANTSTEIDFTTTVNAEGKVSVFTVGDSMAYSLFGAASFDGVAEETGYAIRLGTRLGCGVTRADFVVDGRNQLDDCEDWREPWGTIIDELDPSISLVLAWSWEIYDRRVPDENGNLKNIAYGTDEWNELLLSSVQEAIDLLGSGGGRVVLVNMPCIDYEADTPKHPTNNDPRDPGRVRAVNAVLDEAVLRNQSKGVELIDLNGFLCPDGETYRSHIDGQLVSGDGIHFTPEGAAITWRWLAERLDEITGGGTPG